MISNRTWTIGVAACLALIWARDTARAAGPDHGLAGLVHDLRRQAGEDSAFDSVRTGPVAPDCSREESLRVIDWARGELEAFIAALPDGATVRACYSDILDGPAPARRRKPEKRSRKRLEEESFAFEATAKAVAECSTRFEKEIPPPQRDRARGLVWALSSRGLDLLVCTVR